MKIIVLYTLKVVIYNCKYPYLVIDIIKSYGLNLQGVTLKKIIQ